jgi:very-short-patch-repair endonuclease
MTRLGPRRGTATLRRLVAARPAPTRSVLEDIVLDLLLAAGFEQPDVNQPLIVSGRRVVPDFRWAKQHLILEADGAAWHDETTDGERQALLEAHGERVLRITWAQAVGQPRAVLARVAAARGPRAASRRS